MLAVLKELKSRVRLSRHSPDHVSVDTVVSALHYNVTKLLISLSFTLVACRQYFGEPILCIQDAPNDAAPIPNNVLNSYCFITSTYTVVGPSGGTWQGQGEVERHHAYYQWVPFMLFLQALLFATPHAIWLYWEGNLIHNVMIGIRNEIHRPEKEKLQTLAHYTFARLNTFKWWALGFYSCQVLNFLNVIANVFLTDVFLGGNLCQYGLQMVLLGPQMLPTDAMFPKLTKCLFRKYGPSGTIQTHDALCVMSLNVVNEKIYTALWLWFTLLVLITLVALVWRCFLLVLLTCASAYSRSFVARWAQQALQTPATLDTTYLSPVIRRLDYGDWLFIELLAKNMNNSTYREFMEQLVQVVDQVKPSELQPLWSC